MDEYKLGQMEAKFAEMIWQSAPVASGELVKQCAQVFGGKKSTTSTMLKRLCQRGLFENSGGEVRVLITRADHEAMQSAQFVEETFDGSLPRFLAAFTRRKQLSAEEIDELQKLIDDYQEG